jgi:hypothetical protein
MERGRGKQVEGRFNMATKATVVVFSPHAGFQSRLQQIVSNNDVEVLCLSGKDKNIVDTVLKADLTVIYEPPECDSLVSAGLMDLAARAHRAAKDVLYYYYGDGPDFPVNWTVRQILREITLPKNSLHQRLVLEILPIIDKVLKGRVLGIPEATAA